MQSGLLFCDAFLSLLDWSDFYVLVFTLVPVYTVSSCASEVSLFGGPPVTRLPSIRPRDYTRELESLTRNIQVGVALSYIACLRYPYI